MPFLGWLPKSERFFNQASEQWRRRQRFLLQGEEERAAEAAAEVVRLCQLALSASQRNGDAYVLLANALLSASFAGPGRSDPQRYEFLQARAAAVIHLWYSLPHRGYPITKSANRAIGERMWRIAVDEIGHSRSLSSERAAIALMDSYRDTLAASVLSQASFQDIEGMILRAHSAPESHMEQQPFLEETLPPEVLAFLATVVIKRVLPNESEANDKTTDALTDIPQVLKEPERALRAEGEVLRRLREALHHSDFRQAVGWVTWLIILDLYKYSCFPDEPARPRETSAEGSVQLLRPTWVEARRAGDWDAVLLAAALCEWLGLSDWREEFLGSARTQLAEQAVARRVQDIEQNPQMVVERLLHRHLRGSLER